MLRGLFLGVVVAWLMAGPALAQAPPGGALVFGSTRAGNADIYTMAADGSQDVRLTTEITADESPEWSPDGTQIAFGSDRAGNYDIWVMNADGTLPRRLTDSPAADLAPAWSADGRSIAFQSTRDGNSEIYVMNASGANERRVTTTPAIDGAPQWSPDGRILFESRSIAGAAGAWTMPADGRGAALLALDAAGPTSSPGARIGYHQCVDGNADVYSLTARGLKVRLTTTAGDDKEAGWSPDGARLAFISARNGNDEVYVMNANGSGQTRLTSSPAAEEHPRFRPPLPVLGRRVTVQPARGKLAVRGGGSSRCGGFGRWPSARMSTRAAARPGS